MSDKPSSSNDRTAEQTGYDPAADPDSDPEMLTEQHPASAGGENERDPAEGPDDAAATDG